MQIDFPKVYIDLISAACRRSGINEIGGILFGEHVGPGHFRVAEITIDEPGLVANFKRSIQHALGACKKFFGKTHHNYARFNYLGEWHSHPSYAIMPSNRDDQAMFEIVCDDSVGANFAVLSIVRLDQGELKIGGWAYFPDRTKADVNINVVQ